MERVTYVVASTPRSGSTLLCEGLEATGIVGRPAEVFAPAFTTMWKRYWSLAPDCSFELYLQSALAYGTTANGVYGLKIHWEHVSELAKACFVTGEPSTVLNALFPGTVFINIVRNDRRAQALSLFRAMETNEWCRFDGAPLPEADVGSLVFDHHRVSMLESAIGAQQAGWERYFAVNRSIVLTIEYEQLDQNYRGEIARVVEFLGGDPTAASDIPEPRLKRQSDEVNRRWRMAMESAEILENSYEHSTIDHRGRRLLP
ncbi:Stf0 family sulfotransferase [Microvirga massiliensis]|uniref:Stf0 family sulfotransferase n=1 Tax=Microvirga massiliensis TaxID=1033741 RepID=UPI00062BBE4B|nr:Stf0 family sulfotransferase [Microvirga massiliensis]